MLNKVPEITLYFWVIKILCTTVGETAADYLNDNLGLGLTNTTLIMSGVARRALVFQFRLRQYVPAIYWLAVVLISVVGTLITDNLVDNFGVSLETTTIAFSVVLAWSSRPGTRARGRSRSTRSSRPRREAFYWLAVLFTFALGTAAGDLIAERLELGYWKSALLFAGADRGRRSSPTSSFRLNAILAFWIAYILTRPLGASIGDYLSQPRADGGLGLGTTVTSVIFLLTILAVVVYLTITKRDVIERESRSSTVPAPSDAAGAAARAGRGEQDRGHPGPDRGGARARRSRARRVLPARARTRRTWRSTATAPTPAQGEQVLAERCRSSRRRSAPGGGPGRDQPQRLRRHRRRSWTAASYGEIILETPPSHVSHWLHVDLRERIAHLGYPLTTVTATHADEHRYVGSTAVLDRIVDSVTNLIGDHGVPAVFFLMVLESACLPVPAR